MTKAQREQNGNFELNGVAYRLNDGRELAIYLRRGVPWVARLRGDEGELYTAGEWFRLHGSDRGLHRVHEAAAGSASALPRDVATRIEALHRGIEVRVMPAWISALERAVRGLQAQLASGARRGAAKFAQFLPGRAPTSTW